MRGRGPMHYNDERHEVGPGNLIMTPLSGRHGIENIGDGVLEIVVAEAIPPSIAQALPSYSPVADFHPGPREA